jgi:hypothetical protein
MTKKMIFTFLLSCIFQSVLGQKHNLILTNEQNNIWFENLRMLSFNQQLLKIRNRLLSDTNIFVKKNYPDGIIINDSLGQRIFGEGKPMFIVSGYPVIIDNKTQNNKIINLTNLITQTYIRELFIFAPNDPWATAIYGTSGQFGIIIMKVTKKKYTKLFRRLKLIEN